MTDQTTGLNSRALARAHALAEQWQGDPATITRAEASTLLMEVIQLRGWTQTPVEPARHLGAVRDAARQAAGQPTAEQPLVIPRDAAEAVHAALGQLLDAPAAGPATPTNHGTETEARCCDVQVWPLARVLRDVRCGSKDWTWDEEWADLDKRHAATGYLGTLEQQIRADGVTRPVLIGSDGRLWDGHHRLRIAVRLGIGYVPVEIATRAGAES
ncbi:hypothetical protein [Streptomyces sp. NPDC056632]|uniref:hypothetical protein n=1 Tax=Streptomyces sp. NPDC056632 TaxID=3345884 RepID=UPI00369A314F